MKRFKNILFIADREDGLQAAFELRRHTEGGPCGKTHWFCFTGCPVTQCEFLFHASDRATVTVPLRKYDL